LGDAADQTAAPLVASDPVIRQIRALARDAKPATKKLARTLATVRKTNGFRFFLETLFGAGGGVNAFDSFGHFIRALIPTNSCFDYTSRPQAGCGANFTTSTSASATAASATVERQLREPSRGERSGERRLTPGPGAAARSLLDFLIGEPARPEGGAPDLGGSDGAAPNLDAPAEERP
jgi:hypothetical protein